MTTTRTTATTPTGTTDSARRRSARVSVRTRITVVIALLTAVAMTGAGLLVYALESARIERQVTAQISQEIAEFRNLRIDPNTGEPFDDVGRVLNVFLTRNVPDDDEMLVGYVSGQTPERTAQPLRSGSARRAGLPGRAGRPRRGRRDPRDRVADLRRDVGDARPVTSAAGRGLRWSIVNFLRDEHEELDRTLRTYTLVALLSLGLITTIAAFQSGRLLAPLRTLEETAREITTTDLSRRIPERGNDDITALDPHDQRHARAARRRLRRAATVPRRRRPRAQDPAHRRPRAPRAASTAVTRTTWPRPASSCSTRSTGCRGW